MEDKIFQKIFPFSSPRNNQREIIEKIINAFNNGKTHVILQAPTGTGKSCIAYAIAKYFGEAYILTNQKILQEQYNKELHIPYILGRSNYLCKKDNNLTCEMGVCKGQQANYCDNCPYLEAKDIAFASEITNMNYSYFLNIIKTKKLPARTLIVNDECHTLEQELIKTSTIKLSEKALSYLGIIDSNFPKITDTDKEKFNWLFNIILPKIKVQYLYFKNQITQFKKFNFSKDYKRIINKYLALERIITIIQEILNQLKNNQKIIIHSNENYIEFKVLYGNNLFKTCLQSMGNKFLHMSATVLSKEQYCKNLGLSLDEVEYFEYDSIFPIKNRLIHYIPVGSLAWNKKNKTIPKLIPQIQKILKKHSNEKGIIHTVNYELAEIIINALNETIEGNRLLMPKGNNRQNILNAFYVSNRPYVLISPSLTEGLDLKEDLSRFCIICKMPFANIADNWIKERMKHDINWYNYYTVEQLIQMTGRSIRSETDFATSYILDESFLNFAIHNQFMFPKWWKNAVIDDE